MATFILSSDFAWAVAVLGTSVSCFRHAILAEVFTFRIYKMYRLLKAAPDAYCKRMLHHGRSLSLREKRRPDSQCRHDPQQHIDNEDSVQGPVETPDKI